MVIPSQEVGVEGKDEDDLTLVDLEGEGWESEDSSFSASVVSEGSRGFGGVGVEVKRGVGCIACGPMALLDDVEAACNARRIDLHKEVFEL